MPADLGQISIDIIHPATDKHISKHEEQRFFMASLRPPARPGFAHSDLDTSFQPCHTRRHAIQPMGLAHSGLMHILTAILPWLQVAETPEMYAAIVRPYIDSIPAARIQWVYNILEKKVLTL